MAVDILVSNTEDATGVQAKPRVWLDDDIYYWFMRPLFEALAKRTGQLIDIYEYATFRGDSLVALRDTLSEARRLVLSKPDTWEVVVGWTDISRKQERYATAKRADFVRFLDGFDQVVARAEYLGGSVICLGD